MSTQPTPIVINHTGTDWNAIFQLIIAAAQVATQFIPMIINVTHPTGTTTVSLGGATPPPVSSAG